MTKKKRKITTKKRKKGPKDMFWCSGHKKYLPRAQFYTSSLRAYETRCKKCNGSARTRRRRVDHASYMHHKLRSYERRLGAKRIPSLRAVQDILKRNGGKRSAISGTTEEALSIVRKVLDREIAAHPRNAIVITAREARRLPRKDLVKRRKALTARRETEEEESV